MTEQHAAYVRVFDRIPIGKPINLSFDGPDAATSQMVEDARRRGTLAQIRTGEGLAPCIAEAVHGDFALTRSLPDYADVFARKQGVGWSVTAPCGRAVRLGLTLTAARELAYSLAMETGASDLERVALVVARVERSWAEQVRTYWEPSGRGRWVARYLDRAEDEETVKRPEDEHADLFDLISAAIRCAGLGDKEVDHADAFLSRELRALLLDKRMQEQQQ